MKGVGHQDAVDVLQQKRQRGEVGTNDIDACMLIAFATAREILQCVRRPCVALHGAHAAGWAEQRRESHREGAAAGAEVGPGAARDTGCDETSRVTRIHSRGPRGDCGASLLERGEEAGRVVQPEGDAARVAMYARGESNASWLAE